MRFRKYVNPNPQEYQGMHTVNAFGCLSALSDNLLIMHPSIQHAQNKVSCKAAGANGDCLLYQEGRKAAESHGNSGGEDDGVKKGTCMTTER